MKEFLSKRLKQFKNLLSTKKFKIRKIRSIAIVLIATITFTTLGSNFVYAKNNEVYERNLIAANNDPSVIEAIQNNREVYNSSKIDKFVVADNYMTYATILGKNGAVFFDGTDHLNEAGQCKDGCKAMIATATFIRGTKPGTEEAKYCISYYIACLNCSRNKAQQIGLESYTNPSEKERLSNNSKELKGLFNGMDKYFAEHPEESPISKSNVPKDVINKIKSNRKFVLDNGIFVKENGQNVTANTSVEDAIDVNENGICNSGNHRRTYDHYTHKGADLLVRHGCFDCLYESFKVVPKSEYDTLEKRIKLANDSVRIKQFFIDNGLDFEQPKQYTPSPIISPKGDIISNSVARIKNVDYSIIFYSNKVISISNVSDSTYVMYVDVPSKRMQIKLNADSKYAWDVELVEGDGIVFTNRETGEQSKVKTKNNGSLQSAALATAAFVGLSEAAITTLVNTVISFVCIIGAVAIVSSVDTLKQFGLYISKSITQFATMVQTYTTTLVIIPLQQTLSNLYQKAGEIARNISVPFYFPFYINDRGGNDGIDFSRPLLAPEAAIHVASGGNVITPFCSWAEDVFLITSLAYQGDFDIKRVIPDVPHCYNENYNIFNKGQVDAAKDTITQTEITKEIKYLAYLVLDPFYVRANLLGYYAHYHPLGYRHDDSSVRSNPHIAFFGNGLFEGVPNAAKNVFSKFFKK